MTNNFNHNMVEFYPFGDDRTYLVFPKGKHMKNLQQMFKKRKHNCILCLTRFLGLELASSWLGLQLAADAS